MQLPLKRRHCARPESTFHRCRRGIAASYFSHAFAGGYSAGYYSYIWSEVLDADTVEWFKQHGGLTRENGDRFREMLLSRGGTADALGLFKNFVGRDPYIEPLLKRRGLDRAPGADDTKIESQPPTK